MPVLRSAELSEFVAKSDALGGPDALDTQDFWKDLTYAPDIEIDTSADPFGSAYLDDQIALYTEISGRSLDQQANEQTFFDRAAHVAASNPYNHATPSVLARQLVQLNTALRLAAPDKGARLVDMGCGWGLSSELAAYLGLEVEAVDINPEFVRLVSERAARLGHDIRAVHDTFDTYVSDAPVDVFLFYECLHHAVEPWSLVERLSKMLSPGGKIAICGEPINDIWWPNWVRLDPLSLYCIHKHGWFESGWSLDFITRCFERALLNVSVTTSSDPEIGQFVVASRDQQLNAPWVARNVAIRGGELDGDFIVLGASAEFEFKEGLQDAECSLVIQNFREKTVSTRIALGHNEQQVLALPPGETLFSVGRVAAGDVVRIESETWCPAEEIGNQDTRRLAFQVSGIRLEGVAS